MTPASPALDYDTLASDYAAHRRVHPGVLAALLETGSTGPASRVLDVGCGSGTYAAAIRQATGSAVAGVDPSAGMLERAREQEAALDLHEGRAEALPFADAAFDLVYSVDVIHHVQDRPAFFAEAARVLSPGGLLCTVTDSAADIRRRAPLSSHWPETVAVELARYPSIGTLAIEMTAAGFGAIFEDHAEIAYQLVDTAPWRGRAYSSLHLIGDDAFAFGLAKLDAEVAAGPVAGLSLYTLLWGQKRGAQRSRPGRR